MSAAAERSTEGVEERRAQRRDSLARSRKAEPGFINQAVLNEHVKQCAHVRPFQIEEKPAPDAGGEGGAAMNGILNIFKTLVKMQTGFSGTCEREGCDSGLM